jgi:DNA-directed RNA polymerase subunit beta
MQNTLQIRKEKYGKTERYNFARVQEDVKQPYLMEIQRKPYLEFLKKGIGEVLEEYSPIVDYSDKAELHFLGYTISEKPKYTKEECRRSRLNYTVPLTVKARLVIKETGEVIEQDVYMADVPLMSEEGYFIVNGVERVVISQIVKSASVYFSKTIDKAGKNEIEASLHSPNGTRLSIEQNHNDVLKIIIDQKSKISAFVFLKACGYTNEGILELFDHDPIVANTLEKETQVTEEDALLEIGRRTRPAEVPNSGATKKYMFDTFFSNTYYDFRRVGRYKYNKKLSIASRIANQTLAEDVVLGDKVFAKSGDVVSLETAWKIQNAGINEVRILAEGKPHKIIGNARVKLSEVISCKEEELGINELVYYPLLQDILKNNKTKEKRLQAIKENAKELITTHLTIHDIIAVINYIRGLEKGVGELDNIDHLANRRIASVGELMQNEFRKGIIKLSDSILESMQSHELADITPTSLINARPINKYLKDFLASGQLSQMTEDFNPLSSLANKRRVSAVGPGGIKKERAGAEVRDIHYSHYGRICVVETPEGQGIGLINSLAAFAKINDYGFMETPYKKVDKEKGRVTNEVIYMMADEEEHYFIAQAVEPLNADGTFKNERILCRKKGIFYELKGTEIDYIDVSPKQFISATTSLIPFLENDDTVRALTGSNMQRQAVPLLRAEAPLVGTGIEHKIAVDSGATVVTDVDGVVAYVDASEIRIKRGNGDVKTFTLIKYQKTNKETSFNQIPCVSKGEKVKAGDVIADGYSTKNGELSIGKNVTIAFMNWEGYNYEDAILINERLVKDDTFTSIVLKVEECAARTTKLGDEEITRDIPNAPEEPLRNLDVNGIVRIGAEVKPGDYLVGKVTPKGETELTPEERLLRAIFGEKSREVRDNSLKVPHGSGGIVVDVQIFSRKNKDELETGVNTLVKVYIAKKRKISVGDKMAGRHGNKGVISRVLPEADMPFMANGQAVDIVLNPLGVPSRMNIGQVLEVHLGLIAKSLGWKVATPCFDGARESDVSQLLKQNNLPENGKMQLFDGRTGESFDNKITVGVMYMIKLEHMSENKIHARSTGPYQVVTRQPLGGKAMNGGQRLGEMEVWALEAYGAAHLLQEMMTVKSDDVLGRTKVYENIVKGEPMTQPGMPEAFKVLVKELQSLGLDVKILTEDNKELSISQIVPDETDKGISSAIEKELQEINVDEEVLIPDNEDAEVNESMFDEDSLFDDLDE